MGLFTAFLAYRSGRRSSNRDHEEERERLIEWAEEISDNCGYRRMQHDDEGLCPRYH